MVYCRRKRPVEARWNVQHLFGLLSRVEERAFVAKEQCEDIPHVFIFIFLFVFVWVCVYVFFSVCMSF